MSRYVDGIMIRTFSQEGVEELARWADIPVINGLTDRYHPCQVMADLFTVIEHKGNYRDLIYCWIGDGNNMANSWINAAAVFGFELRVATPRRLRAGRRGSRTGPGGRSPHRLHPRPRRSGQRAPTCSTPTSGPAWARKPSRRSGRRHLPGFRSTRT